MAGLVQIAHAQTIGQNKQPGAPYTLAVKSQLVVETVVVKDKQGKPITGLTAKDFTLTEDGARRPSSSASTSRCPQRQSLSCLQARRRSSSTRS